MTARSALLCLAAASLIVGGCSGNDTASALRHATMLNEPRSVAEFRLSDQHGAEFTNVQLQGKWNVLFAGFTHCPDICPTTLALLVSAQERAGIAPEDLRTVFVSVDPARDTPAQLAEYLAYFNSEWTALSGEKAELDRLMASLKMAYVRVPTGNGEYTMDHSTALVLIDPQGRMRGYFTPPLDAAELAEDLEKITGAGR